MAKQKCPRPPYLIIGPNFLVDEIPPKILGLVQIICTNNVCEILHNLIRGGYRDSYEKGGGGGAQLWSRDSERSAIEMQVYYCIYSIPITHIHVLETYK